MCGQVNQQHGAAAWHTEGTPYSHLLQQDTVEAQNIIAENTLKFVAIMSLADHVKMA